MPANTTADNGAENGQIEVHFSGDNDIAKISCEDGLTPREIQTLGEMIEEDRAWLQSPADGATDLPTAATVSREALKPDPSGTDPDGGTGVATGATERAGIAEDK